MVMKGVPRQALTMTTESSARSGSVSQSMPREVRPVWTSTQLITLKLELNIQSQAIVPSTVGTIQGRRMAARTVRRNGIASLSTSPSTSPNTSFRATAPPVKTKVLRSVCR